jgi:MFS transporter, PPP family, 3-phenylpropionic acid transporter
MVGALYYLGYYAGAAAYSPFLPVFYESRGLSGSEIGLLVAIGPVLALVLAPMIAALADRHGWQLLVLRLGLLGAVAAILILPFTNSFLQLILTILLLALATSPMGPISDGIIALMARERGLSYGKMRLWGSLSWVVLPAAMGVITQQVGLAPVFPTAALLYLLTLPVAQLLPVKKSVSSDIRPPVRLRLLGGSMYAMVACSFFAGTGLFMAVPFASIYMSHLRGQWLVGLFSAVAAASEVPVMLLSERITRLIGAPRTLAVAWSLMACAFLLLGLITEPELLLGAAVLQGLGFGLFLPTAVRLIASLSGSSHGATYQGLFSASFFGLAPLLAGPLAGTLYDAAGPTSVFMAATTSVAIAILLIVVAQAAGAFRDKELH